MLNVTQSVTGAEFVLVSWMLDIAFLLTCILFVNGIIYKMDQVENLNDNEVKTNNIFTDYS